MFNANYVDPNQTPLFAVSDVRLLCLPIALLGVSRLKLIKVHILSRRVNIQIDLRGSSIKKNLSYIWKLANAQTANLPVFANFPLPISPLSLQDESDSNDMA